MISLECNKRKKCPATKKLLGDATRKTVGHCEFCFELVSGNETFSTSDGKILQSAYFQIEADSEKERSKRLKCLQKMFGEYLTTIFEDIPGKNPIIDWKLSTENLMRLNACVEQLRNYNEEILEIFDPERKLKPFKPNSGQIEVWSRFICHRFSLTKYEYSVQDLNDTAVEWTEEDIKGLNSEENLANLRHIAEQLVEKDKKTEEAS